MRGCLSTCKIVVQCKHKKKSINVVVNLSRWIFPRWQHLLHLPGIVHQGQTPSILPNRRFPFQLVRMSILRPHRPRPRPGFYLGHRHSQVLIYRFRYGYPLHLLLLQPPRHRRRRRKCINEVGNDNVMVMAIPEVEVNEMSKCDRRTPIHKTQLMWRADVTKGVRVK